MVERLATVAERELRWWVVRREIGVTAGHAAGDAITALYAAIYDVPELTVAEAGRQRGLAAEEIRDRGANADPDGPSGRGADYWPEGWPPAASGLPQPARRPRHGR